MMLKPIAKESWDFSRAAHLLNRAGFGGTPAEIERLVQLGPEAAVAQLVDYGQTPDDTPDPEWAKPDPARARIYIPPAIVIEAVSPGHHAHDLVFAFDLPKAIANCNIRQINNS